MDPLAATHRLTSIQHASADSKDAKIRQAWSNFMAYTSSENRDALTSQGIAGRIPTAQDPALRWVYWKIYLSEDLSTTPSSWTAVLDRERESYDLLRRKLLRAPDGNYPPGVTFDAHQTAFAVSRQGDAESDLSVNNPLSLDESNPWKTYYAALDVRKTILLDVERTFPDIPLFRQLPVQLGLTNALFVWCLQNEGIGYRQGMHELLATMWLVRSESTTRDARLGSSKRGSARTDEEIVHQILSGAFIEHDVFTLFSVLMQRAKSWFEWQDPPTRPTHAPASPTRPKTVMPIVAKCERIHSLLHNLDPALAQHLASLGIEPQIFALRWVRLMFTREFVLADALVIWDGLFAADASLGLVDYICLAMLVRVRNQLLAADYSTALQILLRYPSSAASHTHIFVQQAMQIKREGANPTTGVALRMNNRDLFGIEAGSGQVKEALAPSSTPRSSSTATIQDRIDKYATVGRASPASSTTYPWTRGSPSAAVRTGVNERGASPQGQGATRAPNRSGFMTDPLTSSLPRSPSIGPLGLLATAYLPEGVSDFAKGLYERADLPQTLNSALANVSRTVAAAAANVAASSADRSASSGFPSRFDESFSATNTAAARGAIDVRGTGHVASSSSSQTQEPRSGAPQSLASGPPLAPKPELETKSNAELQAALEATIRTNKAVASALTTCIQILESDHTRTQNTTLGRNVTENSRPTVSQRDSTGTTTLSALRHIRDVLWGSAAEFDPAVLSATARGEQQPTEEAVIDDCRSISEDVVSSSACTSRRDEKVSEAPDSSRLPMTLQEYSRYGRQMILPDFGLPAQLRLRNSRVLVVGAGGLGCPAIQYLAAAGVGRITIIDHDVVERSNLARQILHSDAKLGVQKAESAAQAARQLNPHIEVVPLCTALSASNARQVLQGQDLVLDCTDNPLTRYLVSDAAVLESVQVVSGAAQGYDGQLVVLHKKIKPEHAGSKAESLPAGELRGPCYRCLFPKSPRPEEVTNCEDGGVLGGITGIVGTMQALEAVKIIAGIGDDTPPLMTLMAPMTSTPFRSVKIRPRRLASCRACGDPAQVPEAMITDLEKEDYISFCGVTTQDRQASTEALPRIAARDVSNGALIIDVRPPIEFGIAKIPDAINIPIQMLLKQPRTALEQIKHMTTKKPPSTQSVVIVCKKGNDSQQALRALVREQEAFKQEQQDSVQQRESTSADLAGSFDPLSEPQHKPSQPEQIERQVQPIAFTDMIGGLRAYSKQKDPTFPVY